MRFPTFLPEELSYCRRYDAPKAVFETLKDRSVEDTIYFFETGCEHESWIKEEDAQELMELLFNWLTEQFFQRKLNLAQIQRIAAAVQGSYKVVKQVMPLDISLTVEQEKIAVNSLMFGASSDLISDLIWHEGLENKKKVIPLDKLERSVFENFQEFIYTGSIQFLWREEPSVILHVMNRANEWHLFKLATFCASVFKRYFTRENVVDYLLKAQGEVLLSLKQEACDFLNKQQYKVLLSSLGVRELEVEIHDFTENGEELLKLIDRRITHVVCHTSVSQEQGFVDFLKNKNRLLGLDLSDTPGVHPALVDHFPNVEELDLSRCPWLDDTTLIAIFQKTPRLIRLKLVEDSQLTFRSWGAMAALSQLAVLDISECRNVDDEELDLLTTSCPQLKELYLNGCKLITEKGIAALKRHCSNLEILSL